jgi:hypothetical protein
LTTPPLQKLDCVIKGEAAQRRDGSGDLQSENIARGPRKIVEDFPNGSPLDGRQGDDQIGDPLGVVAQIARQRKEQIDPAHREVSKLQRLPSRSVGFGGPAAACEMEADTPGRSASSTSFGSMGEAFIAAPGSRPAASVESSSMFDVALSWISIRGEQMSDCSCT